MEQMKLPMPRPRVRLDGPTTVAEADNAALRQRVRLDEVPEPAPQAENPLRFADAHLARSEWSKDGERPPLNGWWEVTDHKTGALLARWWYDGDWSKGDPKDKVSTWLSHAQFMTQYAWRGLQLPHPDVYPCPPYVSTNLVVRAQEAGHSIHTTYVRFQATGIGRGQSETVNAPRWPNGRPRVKL